MEIRPVIAEARQLDNGKFYIPIAARRAFGLAPGVRFNVFGDVETGDLILRRLEG